jgi:hypothetical protein
MKPLDLKVTLRAEHQYIAETRLSRFSMFTNNKDVKQIYNNQTRASVPKYKHRVTYGLTISDLNDTVLKVIWLHQSKNKKEAFLIHSIVEDSTYAVLNMKSDDPIIKELSMLKMLWFPNIKIGIKHTFKNKIPKKHFVPKTIKEAV